MAADCFIDSDVAKAAAFAERMHKGQTRKYTGAPYFTHVMDVAHIVWDTTLSKKAVMVALLHDVVEDTPCDLSDIAREFGSDVAEGVRLLTDEPAGLKSRAWRHRNNVSRLNGAPGEIQTVKAADIVSNTRNLTDMKINDLRFYSLYVKEKTNELSVLTKADQSLVEQANMQIEQAEAYHTRAAGSERD